MRKMILGIGSLLTASLLFTSCTKEETYSSPAKDYLQLINGIWLTAGSGTDNNRNGMPDPNEMVLIDTATQKVFTVFLGNGEVKAYGTFMGSDLDTTTGTWLITPDHILKTTSPLVGAKNYFIYLLDNEQMILKDIDSEPNRWISYYRD